jgi:hypothetical protein
MEISDRFGIHSHIENSPVVEPEVATISKAYWFFSDQRPAWIPADSIKPQSDGHILFHVDVASDDLKGLYPKLDKDFVLTAEGQPNVRARAERGFWNEECYLHIPKDQFAIMVPGVMYELAPAKTDGAHRWRVEGKVTIVKAK